MIPLQFLCRNDHIFSGTLSCPHNYIADSRLDNHPRTERAGPRPVNRIIGWVHARQIQIRSQGVGRQLIHYVKDRKERLTLQVYEKNKRAVHFYQREGFRVVSRDVDEDTGEAEYVMEWKK